MVFKKKRRVRDLLRAALVILLYVGVPIWLFLISSIIDSVGLWCVFLLYIGVAYAFCGRAEGWLM